MPSKLRFKHILNSTTQCGIPKSKISTSDCSLEPRVMLAASALDATPESAGAKPSGNADAAKASKRARKSELDKPAETASNKVSRDTETAKSQHSFFTLHPRNTAHQGLPIGTIVLPPIDPKSLQFEDGVKNDSAGEEVSPKNDSLFVSPFSDPDPRYVVRAGLPTA